MEMLQVERVRKVIRVGKSIRSKSEMQRTSSSPQNRSAADVAVVRQMLAKLKQGEDQRWKKIESVRAAIAAEDYENDLKLTIAADRMLDEVMEKRSTTGPRKRNA